MYAVVLAGGGGTRLWPLSTAEVPKPFLPLLGPRSLLTGTVRRLIEGDELPLRASDFTVVADRRYEALVRAQVPEVDFLPEPCARNTAAAVAFAAARIERPPDEVMLVLPADHAVARPDVFRQRLRDAAVMEPAAVAGLVAMVAADVGWSDIGTWAALLAALGSTVDGYVVPAGASANVKRGDLLVRRLRQTLWLESGPADIYGWPGPVAVLRDAEPARVTIEALLARVHGAADRASARVPLTRDGWRSGSLDLRGHGGHGAVT